MKFDYIVSNPPFKLDISDFRADLDKPGNNERFFAGIPAIPNKDKDKMAIYLLFIQHIMFSLAENGKAAIVVPTGFITAKNGIEKTVRQEIIDKRWLRGVISMPSNIFANTGTNVSVLFIDKTNSDGNVLLMDASKLGEKVKIGKNQKTVLSDDELKMIVDTFIEHKVVEDFTVSVTYDQIEKKNYSLAAGQYFEVKIEYVDLTVEEFNEKMSSYQEELSELFEEGNKLQEEILEQLKKVKYE